MGPDLVTGQRWLLGAGFLAVIALTVFAAYIGNGLRGDGESARDRAVRETLEELCEAKSYTQQQFEDCMWRTERYR